jgi:hypothetical protein
LSADGDGQAGLEQMNSDKLRKPNARREAEAAAAAAAEGRIEASK